MNVLRRVARVVTDEGVAGLARRFHGKFVRPPGPTNDEAETARREYEQQVRLFHERKRALGHGGLDDYYWYHTVDLGNGLVTPGDYDYRRQWSAFGFPDSMAGMRVLDVGSATGYFAFEFERRGATVMSVELPSLADWDMLAGEREVVIKRLMAWQNAATPEEAYHRRLDGPFQFCRTVLESRVTRCYSTVYDLTLDKVGGEPFDLIFAGDILLHLFSPLEALDVLAGLCRGSLVVTIDAAFPGQPDQPLMAFLGEDGEPSNYRAWWQLSVRCLEGIFKRLGFPSVSVAGRYSGVLRRTWQPYAREVIWASR